jgi:hypothetical protein
VTGDERSARELVAALTTERLMSQPETAAMAVDPACVVAMTSMRTTLEAVVAYGRAMGWREAEVVGMLRGSLCRLLSDDVLRAARRVEFRQMGGW